MAHAVAGLAEHVVWDEVHLVATINEMQTVLAGEGGKQAIARTSVLGRGQEVFPSEPVKPDRGNQDRCDWVVLLSTRRAMMPDNAIRKATARPPRQCIGTAASSVLYRA